MAGLAFTASNQQVTAEEAANPSGGLPEGVMLQLEAEGLGNG